MAKSFRALSKVMLPLSLVICSPEAVIRVQEYRPHASAQYRCHEYNPETLPASHIDVRFEVGITARLLADTLHARPVELMHPIDGLREHARCLLGYADHRIRREGNTYQIVLNVRE